MDKKKSDLWNPAIDGYFTDGETDEPSQPEAEATEPQPAAAVYLRPETRSKNLHLLIQPTLFAKLKAIAKRNRISINELIHRVLDEFTDANMSR